jgi:ribokinase
MGMAGPRIVVVGSANTDLTVVADSLPAPGETVLGGDLLTAGGGKGANQAVAAARAGGEVAFVGRVGDDDFGRATIANLKNEGIDVDLLRVDEHSASGVALIVVDREGENLIAVASGANARVELEDVRAADSAIAEADMVLLQFEIPVETVMAAVAAAAKHGTPVMLNPAPVPPRGMPDGLLAGIDYVTPNAVEAAQLLGAGDDLPAAQLAEGLLEHGAGAAFVTLGAMGVCVRTSESAGMVLPPAVEALDTVGAGDCFSGALAVALAEGRGAVDAAQFAAAAAALSVQVAGAQPSLPRRAAVLEMCENTYGTGG